MGLERTASTFFMLSPEADTGDIVSQKMVVIEYSDNARSLYDKLMDLAVVQIEELWQDFEKQCVTKIPQHLSEGNTWRKRKKEDSKIDWRMPAAAIYNLVRALSEPYAGAHFLYKDQEIKVWRVEEIKESGYGNIEPGKVLAVHGNGQIDVKTSDNIIRIIEADKHGIACGEYL